MNNTIDFITLFGHNGLFLIGGAVICWIIAAVSGIVMMVFEKAEKPWLAFFAAIMIINLIWTLIEFAGG